MSIFSTSNTKYCVVWHKENLTLSFLIIPVALYERHKQFWAGIPTSSLHLPICTVIRRGSTGIIKSPCLGWARLWKTSGVDPNLPTLSPSVTAGRLLQHTLHPSVISASDRLVPSRHLRIGCSWKYTSEYIKQALHQTRFLCEQCWEMNLSTPSWLISGVKQVLLCFRDCQAVVLAGSYDEARRSNPGIPRSC